MPLLGEWGMPIIDEAGYVHLDELAADHQDAMELMQVRLAQDYLNVWASVPDDWPDERKYAYLRDALSEMQLVHGSDAAALAADFLRYQRNGMDLPMVLVDPAGMSQVEGALGWALRNPEAKKLLWGAMQRMAMQPYRETIRRSAFAAGNGYARVPEPNSCAFCLMLASRGAVYSTADEARFVFQSGSSGSQKDGDAYHDNCKCQAIEVNSRSGLSESNIYLERLWGETMYNDPDTRLSPKVTGSTGMQKKWKETLKETDLPWLSNRQIRR